MPREVFHDPTANLRVFACDSPVSGPNSLYRIEWPLLDGTVHLDLRFQSERSKDGVIDQALLAVLIDRARNSDGPRLVGFALNDAMHFLTDETGHSLAEWSIRDLHRIKTDIEFTAASLASPEQIDPEFFYLYSIALRGLAVELDRCLGSIPGPADDDNQAARAEGAKHAI